MTLLQNRAVRTVLMASLVGSFVTFLPPSNPASATPDSSEVTCLAQNVYHEARGEGATGMVAVAAVALNRAMATGRSVCSVVYERNGNGCQFSWTCNGRRGREARESESWRQALTVARLAMKEQGAHPDPTRGAMYFNTCSQGSQGQRIGAHCFRRGSGFPETRSDGPAGSWELVSDPEARDGYTLLPSIAPEPRAARRSRR